MISAILYNNLATLEEKKLQNQKYSLKKVQVISYLTSVYGSYKWKQNMGHIEITKKWPNKV